MNGRKYGNTPIKSSIIGKGMHAVATFSKAHIVETCIKVKRAATILY